MVKQKLVDWKQGLENRKSAKHLIIETCRLVIWFFLMSVCVHFYFVVVPLHLGSIDNNTQNTLSRSLCAPWRRHCLCRPMLSPFLLILCPFDVVVVVIVVVVVVIHYQLIYVTLDETAYRINKKYNDNNKNNSVSHHHHHRFMYACGYFILINTIYW